MQHHDATFKTLGTDEFQIMPFFENGQSMYDGCGVDEQVQIIDQPMLDQG